MHEQHVPNPITLDVHLSAQNPPQQSVVRKLQLLHTSTPNALRTMDFSFLKCYESIIASGVQAVDSDSGYMSNQTEDGSSLTKEATMYISKATPFLSEDALQEQPASTKTAQSNQHMYQQQISYLSTKSNDSSIVPDSDVDEAEDVQPINISPELEMSRLPIEVTLRFDDGSNSSNKENYDSASNKTATKTKRRTPRKRKRALSTPKKRFSNPVNGDCSPDLFGAVDDVVKNEEPRVEECKVAAEQYVSELDQQLMKSIQNCLTGVLPPPSVTTTHITVAQMLEQLQSAERQQYFWHVAAPVNQVAGATSLIANTDLEGAKAREWPLILHDRCHGLSYNHSRNAEDIETIFMKYAQRYIGAETQSSCTVFDSNANTPSRRRANRLRWVNNSPGRRLSHLARRRITFSSANIQAVAGSSHSRQILVDAKRFDLLSRRASPRKSKTPRKSPRKSKSPRKTPRSKTPGKTPRKSPRLAKYTPSSSTKKRLASRIFAEINNEASTSTLRASATKRALFQSPDKSVRASKVAVPSTSNAAMSTWKKRNTPKRALFMSPSKTGDTATGAKRKRLDSDEEIGSYKYPKSMSMQNPSQTSTSTILRVKSEASLSINPLELSEHHKKKLQWAVYEALRSQHIRMDHENFKQYASVLARVTRRLLPVLGTSNVGTSERMLRITKQHVFAVIKGRSVDEIVSSYESSRQKIFKPTGYVSKEVVQDSSAARNSVFQDCANTIHSSEKKTMLQCVEKKAVENKVDRVKKIIKF